MLVKIRAFGEKAVIVSSFTSNLDFVVSLVDKLNLKYFRIDGKVKNSDRQSLINRFNSDTDKTPLFLLSTRAGGVGINLIGACRLIMLDADWNPAADLQAMARVWREGQKKTVFIYRLYTLGSIEESILKVRGILHADHFLVANIRYSYFQRQEQKMNVASELDSTNDPTIAEASDDDLKTELVSFDRPRLEALIRPKDVSHIPAVPLEDVCDACLRSILSETTELLAPISVRKHFTTKNLLS